MREYSKEDLNKSADMVDKAMPIAVEIIGFLESKNIDLDVGVIAAGIAFSTGASQIGASLPSAIDIVRVFYKQASHRREAH